MEHSIDKARYAVIFISRLGRETDGYAEMADEMVALVKQQPGFVSFDSVRDESGMGITVSYWESMAAIEQWQREARHVEAKQLGRSQWYDEYTLHITRVEQSRHHGCAATT